MKKSFRGIDILTEWEKTKKPLDRSLSDYFRSNRTIGAKNRRFITETVFQIVRLQKALDYEVANPSWQTRFEKLATYPEKSLEKACPHIRVSFPLWYYQTLEKAYGNQTQDICLLSNQTAPLTIRVNTRLSTRDALFARWCDCYPVRKTAISPMGITWGKRHNFFTMQEFKQGLFEVQDEGSQLVALFVNAKPGEKILDYCSGSGGKSLAFAPQMQGKGQIYLHDIRLCALTQAKKRLQRAQIKNAQIILPRKKAKNHLLGKMDKVLLDVPCSGSGTLRRNPETKYSFTKENLINLQATQRQIFQESLQFIRKKGTIIYATCSLFPEENIRQVEYFCAQHPVRLLNHKTLLLQKNGHDGFFMAAFEAFC